MRSTTEDVGLIKEQKGPSTGPEAHAAVLDGLAATFDALGSTRTRFVFSIICQLTDGEPVAVAPVATHHGLSPDNATRLLRKLGAGISRDGEVTSLRVSLKPTSYSYRITDRQLYTWCAPDAILFPIFFDQTANISSIDPVDNHRIQLTVSAERVENCQPESAVV